jgi:superfamily II DNA or RNA helicase
VKYRLGLSATPARLWDDEGNNEIKNFFNGEPVFIWDMKKAISPPEGYSKCLCDYKYYIHESYLNEKELGEYEELSKKIKRKMGMLTNGGKIKINIDNNPALKFLIIKKCENNILVLSNILDEYSNALKKCLIYCNDKKHMAEVTKLVTQKGYTCLQFFGDMDGEERERVFKLFKEEDIQFLIAIKCLDQGVDLPICDSAIILASSKNSREYVQRRGRILRLNKGKKFAIVHDILVFPYMIEDLIKGKKRLYDYESRLLKNQLERVKIFINNSMNSSENYLKVLNYGEIINNSIEQP